MTNMNTLKSEYRDWIKLKGPLTVDRYFGPYQYRFHNVDTLQGERSGIINKLILPLHEQIEPFLNITPEVHACLVPKIRLFKVFNNSINCCEPPS